MFKKYIRPIAMILSVVMMISIISVSTGGFGILNAKARQTEADDMKTAEDISNLTGVDVNTILDIKKKGLSWNEVLKELESVNGKNENGRFDRDKTLLVQNLEEDLVNQLISEGYSGEEIIEARLLVERVQFQLNEILNKEKYSASVMPDTAEDDLSKYEDLAERIDIKQCLPFMLRLRSEIGTFEMVMDEYLTCLQLDIDYSMYFEDKAEYLKNKSVKIAGKTIITVQRLEEKFLLVLQKENTEIKAYDEKLDSISANNNFSKNETSFIVPSVPVPEVQSVIPENPADNLMREIKEKDPRKGD